MTVTLLGRPGCHLCDDARVVIQDVVAEFEQVALVERSIVGDAELTARFGEEIPVVLIDDAVHTIWRVDADRLSAALRERMS